MSPAFYGQRTVRLAGCKKGGEKTPALCYNGVMQTPIDFGKSFLYTFFDQRDADSCLKMLAGDLVWITPEEMHHFLSEGAVLRFLRKQISADGQARYVDIASIKSSPSADNIMTVAYEVNLVSGEDEKPLHLRCSMAVCRRGRRQEITFLHFSRRAERNSTEQLRDFVTHLPCGVMILACLDGQREEAVYYNEYFAHRLRYRQEEFARAMKKNPFFMASEEDRERIQDEIARARKNGGNIAANLRFYRRDGNSFYYRMLGAPAYQADGGTVYYCVFEETTGYRLTVDRLQGRLDSTAEILRQVPEGICGIELPAPGEKEPLPAVNGGRQAAQASEADATAGGRRAARVPEAEAAAGSVGAAGAAGMPAAGATAKEPPFGKKARVFFVSKNIPSLFGVSNSAYMKNILQDPLFGLEVTSITREKLLRTDLFSPGKAGSAGPVSCGIFRLRRAGSKAGGSRIPSDAAPVQEAAETAETIKTSYGSGTSELSGIARSPEASELPAAQAPEPSAAAAGRVELVVRRVRGRDGAVRLYLFYYDREAQQRDQEARVDRAMKMGRAGMEQLRADLRRAKEEAARAKSAQNAALKALEEKYEGKLSRAEDQLLEEKNRAVLLSRQLEEARASKRRLEEELETEKAGAAQRVRSIEARAEQKVRAEQEKLRRQGSDARQQVLDAWEAVRRREAEAEQRTAEAQEDARKADAARHLLEEQLREAQERNRILERDLRDERSRRRLLEERAQGTASAESAVLAHGAPGAPGAEPVQDAAPKVPPGFLPAPQGAGGAAQAAPGGRIPGAAGGSGLFISGAAASKEADPALAGADGTPVPAGAAAAGSGRSGEAAAPGPHLAALGGDWMAAADSLKVFSHMDPGGGEPAGEAAAGPQRWQKPGLEAAEAEAGGENPAGESVAGPQPRQKPESEAAEAEAEAGPASEPAPVPEPGPGQPEPLTEEGQKLQDMQLGILSERRIRVREEEKARGRLRALMDSAEGILRPARSEEAGGEEKAKGREDQKADAEAKGAPAGKPVRITQEEVLGVIRDLTEAAEPEKSLLQEKAFSPLRCLRNVLLYEDMACREKGISLRMITGSGLPASVSGFNALLTRALCDLVEDAVAHTAQGGTISVRLRADRPSGGLVSLTFRIDTEDGSGTAGSRHFAGRGADSAVRGPGEPELFTACEAAALMGGSVHTWRGARGSAYSMTAAVRIP